MKTLSHILGASARFDLLRALYYQHGTVGLRQLARLSGVHPHSAERMLKDLVSEKVVIRKEGTARTSYSKNTAHTDWHVLKAVFDAAERTHLESRRSELDQRARAILSFIEEAGGMLKKARRSIRVA